MQGPAEIPDDLELLAWGICPWAPF